MSTISVSYNKDTKEINFPETKEKMIIFGLPIFELYCICNNEAIPANPGHFNQEYITDREPGSGSGSELDYLHTFSFMNKTKKHCINIFSEWENLYFLDINNNFLASDNSINPYPIKRKYVDQSIVVVTGGYIFDGEKWELVKTAIDYDRRIMVTGNHSIEIKNCYVAYDIGCSEMKVVLLDSLSHFAFCSKHEKINDLIIETQLPVQLLQKCNDIFISRPNDFVIINCKDGIVLLPSYLKPFFGLKALFINNEIKHNIKCQALMQLNKWMLKLFVSSTLPSSIDLIDDTKLNCLLRVVRYFEIDFFDDFLRKLNGL